MKIDIIAEEAKLTKVKLNTEGSRDNPTSITDLSFECLAGGKLANTFVGVDVSKIFWDKDGCIKLLGITNIESMAELKNATMKFAEVEVQDVKVTNLKFKPTNGYQMIFKLQVQVRHTPEQLVAFDRLQMTTNPLRLYTAQEDLFPVD